MIDLTQLDSETLKSIAYAHGVEMGENKDLDLPVDVAAKLEAMQPIELLRLYTQWHLGHQSWADEILSVWEQVNQKENK